MDAFGLLFRVRYAECDAQGVVFNARYADYVDLAATEFVRAMGYDYQSLVEQGLETQVVRLVLEWQAPARFDEVLCARVECTRLGRTSYTLTTTFERWGTDEVVATGECVYVVVTTEPYRPTPLPEVMREVLETGAPGVIVDQAAALPR